MDNSSSSEEDVLEKTRKAEIGNVRYFTEYSSQTLSKCRLDVEMHFSRIYTLSKHSSYEFTVF